MYHRSLRGDVRWEGRRDSPNCDHDGDINYKYYKRGVQSVGGGPIDLWMWLLVRRG